MQWLLLNQLFVNLDCINSKMSVLEEVVSSEVQLVRLLVSGTVSSKTMTSRFLGTLHCPLDLEQKVGCHL